MKLQKQEYEDGEVLWVFFCPGCSHLHSYRVAGKKGPIWQFDGSETAPTFKPSLLNTRDNHPDPTKRRCHLYVTRGMIEYCPDSSHELAGKTTPLVDFKDI